MKKTVKITLWTLCGLALLITAAILSADLWVSRIVQKEVRSTFARIPDAEATIGRIYISFASGSAIVKDITFATKSLAETDSITGIREPGLALNIPTLAIWNIHYLDLLKNHRLTIHKITVEAPILLVYLDERHPESIFPVFPKDSTLARVQSLLVEAGVRHIEVHHAQAHIYSTSSPLQLALDSLSAECHQVRYQCTDSVFSYNDSVYSITVRSLTAHLPDGFTTLEMHDLHTSDQGPCTTGYTRLRNTGTPKHLADLRKEPVTWLDIQLNAITTSALNPIRKIRQQDLSLDSVRTDIRRLHFCRDARYEPKQPFPMPQEVMRRIPADFLLRHLDALVRKMDVEYSSTDINCGEIHLKNLRMNATGITNRQGAVARFSTHAPFGEQGIMEAQLDLQMDEDDSFRIRIDGRDIETHDINSFLRPLMGMTCECHVNRLEADYSGNRTMAKGQFCLQYNGLDVHIHKEDDIPYKVMTKHADTFTNLANSLIPKSNPTAVDIRPRSYNVEWKRDEWKPVPLYLLGPCVDGVIKTMLPGLFVHKQTRPNKTTTDKQTNK